MEDDVSFIEKDIKYQEGEWRVQRAGWIIMAVFLLLGLLGFFGDAGGLLSRKRFHLEKGMSVNVEKFLRMEKSVDMNVTITNPAVKDVSVAINNDYFNKLKITQVIPEPENVEIIQNKTVYNFKQLGSGRITFFLDPLKKGEQKLSMNVNGESVNITQFIYF